MKVAWLVLCGLVALLLAPKVWASVTTNTFVAAQTPNNGKQSFIQGTDSAGTYKTLYTAGGNGSRCNGIIVSTNDSSAAHVMTFEIVNGGNTYHIFSLNTAMPTAGQYTTASPISSIGLPVDNNSNPYVALVSGDVLKVTFATALTSSDEIDVLAACSDF